MLNYVSGREGERSKAIIVYTWISPKKKSLICQKKESEVDSANASGTQALTLRGLSEKRKRVGVRGLLCQGERERGGVGGFFVCFFFLFLFLKTSY